VDVGHQLQRPFLPAMVSVSAALFAAVKKTLRSTGGLVWKTHAFATPSVHARQNAKVRCRNKQPRVGRLCAVAHTH
jgi:hypothetical protein